MEPNITPDAEALRALLPPSLRTLPIYPHTSIDSTNAEGKRLCLPPEANAALIVASTQTAGRGRMDRSFYSPPASGLYMTLVYTTDRPIPPISGLTPAVAVAAAEAAEALTDRAVDIKWVNDLYQSGRKVGGILVEAVPTADMSATRLIIGIGINLTTRAFPDGMRAPAGSLADTGGRVPSPEALAAAITARLFEILPAGLRDGFRGILTAYRAHSLLRAGDPIDVFKGTSDAPRPAVVVGIADDFSLTVQFPDGHVESLSDGEISVRSIGNSCI